jgi:hypothetical protein
MKVAINNYYRYVIEDMISEIKIATPGKRAWYTQDFTNNYTITERSTFPLWSKFFYEHTPKRLIAHYKHDTSSKSYEDGYYNGNTRELLVLLYTALNGLAPKSERQSLAFNLMLKGKFEEIREFEERNNHSYFYLMLL